MSSEKRHNDSILSSGDKRFRIEGVVQLEDQTSFPADTTLAAYIFDCGGQILGTADIDTKGGFQISIGLDYPGAIELVIAPADDQPEEVRKSSAFIQRYTPEDWKTEGKEFVLKPKVFLPRDIWWPLLPVRICVTGHVRKVQTIGDRTEVCPVPYVKVEIFDVDREGCWWPYIRRWWEWLWDRRVIRI